MRRSRYKRRRYYGKGAKDLIRPTLNKGRVFVGEGLLKKQKKKVYGKGGLFQPYFVSYLKKKYYGKGLKKLTRPTLNKGRVFIGEGVSKKTSLKKKKFYGKGIFAPLLLSAVVPKILDKIL